MNRKSLYAVMSHLYDVAMEGYSSNKAETFYRITYNGIGVYQALKENITMNEWRRILNSELINWLPKPPESTYGTSDEFRSYFTEDGYDKFNQLTMPVICKYLDENKIKIETFTNVPGIVYRDRYQVVCGTTKPKRK